MIAGLIVHLTAYVAVCGMLVVIWALGPTGSFEELRGFVENPDTIEAPGFWPIWPIVTWGAAVAIHLAAVVAFGVFGRGRRRHRRAHGHEMEARARAAAEIGRGAVEAVLSGAPRRGRTVDSPGRNRDAPARRWVTVMFTDIANSTQLNEALGDDAWSRLLRAHRETVRRAFLARGGEEVSTQGDGFLARFESPAEAVLCAVDIQRATGEEGDPEVVRPRVRIGIHAGEAVEDDGDLVGRVVNLAARVAAEAEPGEIMVTEPVAEHLGGRIGLEDRGVRELKGVAQPRHLLSVVWEGAEAAEPTS